MRVVTAEGDPDLREDWVPRYGQHAAIVQSSPCAANLPVTIQPAKTSTGSAPIQPGHGYFSSFDAPPKARTKPIFLLPGRLVVAGSGVYSASSQPCHDQHSKSCEIQEH